MNSVPQYLKLKELDGKRWFVRILLLASVFTILMIKIYLTIYIIDRTIGLYSVLTSFVLFNILFISYFRYRDPYVDVFDKKLHDNQLPLVSIVVPVKNEEDIINTCVLSCLNQSYAMKEIIVINDGSTDKTGTILDELKQENKTVDFKIIHLAKSVGKKKAIEVASKIAKGEIYAFMDSDCDMAHDATEKAVQIFHSDPQLGALTGHGRVKNRHSRGFFDHFLEKLQDVYADGACRAQKGMESTFSSVTCCSGSLSFYRREAIQNFIHEWAHDKFLGIEFKFATDRRMTAHVLSTKPPISLSENHSVNKQINGYWKVKYSQHIRVNIGVPSTLMSLIKQQIRWRKSFIRSLFSTGGMFWKRPFYVALIYYLQTSMKFFRPYIVANTVFLMPFFGDYITSIVWFSGILFTGMIYAVDFRLRNPGDRNWLYRPFFTLLSTFIYTWLLIYAAITIKKTGWR
ncbi:MAG: glycosyltransferase [Nitrosopumilus sp.]|nr:glycosyltransferase [Nitrosopumilus sp.]